MKIKALSAFVLYLLLINYKVNAQEKGEKKIIHEKITDVVNDPPPDNLVPNKSTAIKIAEAVWLPIYGKKIYNEKPFIAELTSEGIWIVKGTLPDGFKGGVAYIEIQKRDCKILKIYHGK